MKIKNIKSTIGEVEDILYEMSEDILGYLKIYEFEVEDSGGAVIETDGVRIVIPDLELSARFGEYLLYNRAENIYEADFSLTLIYEEDEIAPENYMYFEQDGLAISLYNFLSHYKDIDNLEEISDIPCEVIFELEEEEI